MPDKGNSAPVPPEPWRSFLRELDERLKGPVELRCLGGFVITQQYGIGRETSDIDYLALVCSISARRCRSARRTGIEAASQIPRIYAVRGNRDTSRGLRKQTHSHVPICSLGAAQVFALDATDLALSKLERNAERDREDVLRLARAGLLDPHILKDRYYAELRPYLLSKLSLARQNPRTMAADGVAITIDADTAARPHSRRLGQFWDSANVTLSDIK